MPRQFQSVSLCLCPFRRSVEPGTRGLRPEATSETSDYGLLGGHLTCPAARRRFAAAPLDVELTNAWCYLGGICF